MSIALTVLIVVIVDLSIGLLICYIKGNNLRRDEDLFVFKLEQILKDKNLTSEERKSSALELCRMTEGKLSTGAHFALSNIL